MLQKSQVEEKKLLRKHYLALREHMPLNERKIAEAEIVNNVLESMAFSLSDFVCSYVSFASELSTNELNQRILAMGKTLLLPKILPNHEMAMIVVDAETEFEKNTYGISEPKGLAFDCHVVSNMLCLIPLLAYDDQGYRLGYGGGYYDRFLAQYPHVKSMGIAFSWQLHHQALPHEEHDKPLNMIADEYGLKVCN